MIERKTRKVLLNNLVLIFLIARMLAKACLHGFRVLRVNYIISAILTEKWTIPLHTKAQDVYSALVYPGIFLERARFTHLYKG